MSKVLVTGGAGYIGAHVAAELLKSGYSIRIYDDFSNGLHRRVDGKFRDIVDGDMLDRVKLLAALDGIDAVIHLAAKKAVEESVKDPLKYYENNVGGSLNLLGAMAAKGVKQLVYSSSAAVYSPNDKEAVVEDDPTAPLSPYGASKLLSEQLISSVGSAEQISNISLRYFNVIGSNIAEFGDNSKDNLVPKVFLALKNGKRPQIYGSDYPTPDGTCIRDYIHVQDLALAHLAALKKVESGYISQVYNVGSGKGYSVKEMMDQISKSLGRDINPEVSPARAGDSPKLIASIDKIKEQLGWSPKASLEEMIDSAWQAEVART
ncbi:MAG: UDP-glucose 4-epimerase GalE [Candidatus Nanopelagicaceae bacterium]|nr:UDP-glucose 4-epimerase GalE [Candidatus Nanopelagicaceae bacterium]